MAIYKSVKGVGKTPASLKSVLEYIGKSKNEEERVYKTSGINVSEDYELAFKQMMMTKRIYDKLDGRQYRHHIQSFKPGEVSPELAHKIAIEFAEKNFKNFDVFISTHIDTGHIHNHFIINTIDRETGLKFRELNKKEFEEKKELKNHEFYLENLKKSSDNLCREYGLFVIDKTNIKSLNIYDKKVYNAITKNNGKESYKTQLALTIQREMKQSKTKDEFIKNMLKNDVIVDWQEHKKNITFKFLDANKKSIRLSNLEKTYKEDFLTKEGLEREFIKNQEREKITENNNQAHQPGEEEKNREKEYQKILAEHREKERLRLEREIQEKKAKALKLKKSKSRGFGLGY